MSELSDSDRPSAESGSDRDLLCYDLPCRPLPGIGKVLVTGASGYVGGRLIPELIARGYQVRALVRASSPEYEELWPGAEIVVADALDKESLSIALRNINTAYYLIHSMLLGPRGFEAAEIEAASNFREAAEENEVQRIIYLGALGDVRTQLSSHLRSRMHVSGQLERGEVPVTVLRAAIIIGSGSASYEIIHHLVKNLPVLPYPPWATNRCQPISIRDVVKYLVGVLETPETSGKTLDIGGPDVLTYCEMLQVFARLVTQRRVFLSVFFLSDVRAYAYVTSLVTPVPAPITLCLIEGLRNEVVCENSTIRELVPFTPISYEEAIVRAMNREEQDNVRTRWSGAYPPAYELAMKLHEIGDESTYTDLHVLHTAKTASSLFQSISKVGGKEGWFSNNWLWRMRGVIDRILLGVGDSRGRRSQATLQVNDVIDFWRVEGLEPNRRLLLRAEMKLPGKAWLEFRVDDEGHSRRLSVAPYFLPRGLAGRLYWFALVPFHQFIFSDLIEQIERRS